MSVKSNLTLVDMLYLLRQQLVDAIAEKNRDNLVGLKMIFSRLVEAAYDSKDEQAIHILVALEDAARDGTMGVAWKSDIPTNEAIRSVFSPD